jgi:hypothetical protein
VVVWEGKGGGLEPKEEAHQIASVFAVVIIRTGSGYILKGKV